MVMNHLSPLEELVKQVRWIEQQVYIRGGQTSNLEKGMVAGKVGQSVH